MISKLRSEIYFFILHTPSRSMSCDFFVTHMTLSSFPPTLLRFSKHFSEDETVSVSRDSRVSRSNTPPNSCSPSSNRHFIHFSRAKFFFKKKKILQHFLRNEKYPNKQPLVMVYLVPIPYVLPPQNPLHLLHHSMPYTQLPLYS